MRELENVRRNFECTNRFTSGHKISSKIALPLPNFLWLWFFMGSNKNSVTQSCDTLIKTHKFV